MVRTLSTMRSCSVSGHVSATANWTCYVEMQLVVTCGKLDRRWTPWLSENTLPEPRSPHPTRSSWPTAAAHHSVAHAGYQVFTSSWLLRCCMAPGPVPTTTVRHVLISCDHGDLLQRRGGSSPARQPSPIQQPLFFQPSGREGSFSSAVVQNQIRR